MKKKYLCKLSLWMAVLMILLSVPTNAVTFPSTGTTATEGMSTTEELTETTLTDPDEEIVESFEWIIEDTASTETGLQSPSDFDSTTSTTSGSQFLTTPTIPDGVYALHSLANPGQWMSVLADRYSSGAALAQRAYSASPVSSFSRGGLFKISQYQDTNAYVIRPMTNSMMGVTYSGSSVQIQGIDRYDDNVNPYSLFTITWNNGGYVIESVLDDICLAAPSSAQYVPSLVAQPSSVAGDRAKWQLQPYTGVDRCGVTVVRGGALIAGRQVTVRLAAGWSTMIGVTVTDLSLSSQYASIATGTWSLATSTLTVNLHDDGDFQIIAPFEDVEDDIVQNYGITYTVTLPIAEGLYYIQNKALELYVQIDNDTAPDYSANGAALELFAFDGGAYQQWTLEHVVDGYYKILSLCDKAASIDASYVNAERHIWQAFYLGDTYYNQQWKFTFTGRGTYVIRPRSGEAYSTDWCWAAQDDEAVNNGPNVEHKAYTDDSNYMDEWCLQSPPPPPEAFLLGIIDPDPHHDHETVLEEIQYNITQLGYSGFDCVVTNSISKTDVQNKMANAKIFVSRSHGDTNSSGSCIILNESDTERLYSSDIYNFVTDTPVIDLSDCDLMLFVGCYTSKNEGISLPDAAVAAGAKAAIGFNIDITCEAANNFTRSFFNNYNQDVNIEDVARYAATVSNLNFDTDVRVVLNSDN